MSKFILIFLLLIFVTQAYAQSHDTTVNPGSLGISFQGYPAGLIINGVYEKGFATKDALLFRLGFNLTDRKDFSEYNDHEEGAGFGISMGYRRYFSLRKGKLFGGFNADLWNMWIDWENQTGSPFENTSGSTYALVLQPWLEFGYVYRIPESRFQIGVSTGFGREINIITSGKEVGQGWMNSILLNANWNLSKK
jgi:hypothetical protein